LRYLVDEGDELHDGGAPEVSALAPYQIQQNLTHTQIFRTSVMDPDPVGSGSNLFPKKNCTGYSIIFAVFPSKYI
jgi:hypothetical protein